MSFIKKIQYKLEPHPEDHVIWYSVKALIKRYGQDNLSQLGGQLAYFFVLSLFPFLMLVNQIITMMDFDSQQIISQWQRFIPENMLYILDAYLHQLSASQSLGIFTFSAVTTIGVASKAIQSLLFSLNRAFRREKPISFLKSLISYPLTAIMLVMTFLSLLFASVGRDLFNRIVTYFGLGEHWGTIWQVVRSTIPLAALIIILAVLYNIIVPRGFPRRYTFVGATFAVSLWIIMSLGISYYTSNFGRFSIIYGSLGAIIIMLLFLYWSGIVVVLGGELAHILAMRKQGNFEYDAPKAVV